MFNHEIYATAFARAVALLRDPRSAKDQQKAALRTLVALAGLSSATLRCYDGALAVDDVAIPSSAPGIAALLERLQMHGMSEVMVGRGAEPRELLALLRFLAGPPGGRSVREHLRDAGSRKVMVILLDGSDPDESPHRARSVTQAFDVEQIEALGAVVPEAPSVPGVTEPGTLSWDAVNASAMTEIDLGFAVPEAAAEAAAPSPPAAEPAPPPAPATPTEAAAETRRPAPASGVEAVLAELHADPYGGPVLDRLSRLGERVQQALREQREEDAIRVLAALIRLEPGAPEGSPRNAYGIALRRALTTDTLRHLAPWAFNTPVADEVTAILHRGRGDAAEVLLDLLADSKVRRERFAYLQVLRGMPQGIDQLVHMLGHPEWYVARNVADLMGDVRLEESVPALGRLLGHAERRVRLSAAIALGKIGTPATVDLLRRALKEGDADLRIQVASGIGRSSRALAMPLVTLIEAESSIEVVAAYYAALGRIGTPEAVQALAKAAEPGGRLVGRKSAALRVAAVEGLRLAGAGRALAVLADDADRQVRDAVRQALEALRAT